jgi:inner membrane protein
MKINIALIKLLACLWAYANLFVCAIALPLLAMSLPSDFSFVLLLFPVAAALGSLPISGVLFFLLPVINRQARPVDWKMRRLYAMVAVMIGGYIFVPVLFFARYISSGFLDQQFYLVFLVAILVPGLAAILALRAVRKGLFKYFNPHQQVIFYHQSNPVMEPFVANQEQEAPVKSGQSITYKGITTGILILVMLIPSIFLANLVAERKQRQQEVVNEISSKWAGVQTIAGIHLSIPYVVTTKDAKGNIELIEKQLICLPEKLTLTSQLIPEIRPRSIYKVLLYRSVNQFKGNFQIRLPKDIDPLTIQWKAANICMGLTEIKGIEERVTVLVGGQEMELSPGLPVNDRLAENGLSAPIDLSAYTVGQPISFNSTLKLKGSEQLHFLPLAGNSQFFIRSAWKSPSFDGSYLPGSRIVNDSGFNASWAFNKANLPFGTTLNDPAFKSEKFAFGITMVQPSDQYAKTDRSVKYAILFIGLTFSLFFIVELMQKNPVHPVQYVLIGIALSIFYTLLLSLSEFIQFDLAYAIAAVATILLITLYAKGHFRSWKTAAIFSGVLSSLYLFTFVLVRLEDTALLIGSIGLFAILSLVMYASRRINWYGVA